MPTRLCLVTNNAIFSACTAASPVLELSIQLSQGSAYDVLVTGRDLIHQGWCLLNHPLYGNFRPGQQPIRSLLLSFDSERNQEVFSLQREIISQYYDDSSLNFIEQAIQIYEPFTKSLPSITTVKKLTPSLWADCVLIDKELMHMTLKTSGINVPSNHMEE